MKEPWTTIFRAGAVRDAAPSEVSPAGPVNLRPGAVAAREGRIVAVGETAQIEREAKHWGPSRFVDLPDRLILPAMVNAHAHLDLTDLGPVPYESAGRDFIAWIEMVMARRPRTEEEITRAVRNGLRMSREAGVGWIGDIAGSDIAVRARIHASPAEWVTGNSYLECFGIGAGAQEAADAAYGRWATLCNEAQTAKGDNYLEIYLQPHASYSAGLPLFEMAHFSLPGSYAPATHLHETQEEIDFIRDGTGPFVELLKRLGKWDESIQPRGIRPIRLLAEEEVFWWAPWLCAHCNYMNDDDIHTLAYYRASVAYCPIASEYFGHMNHRYRDMLAAGLNVCLGTDSIICQPSGKSQPLGVLPQMRCLYRRDATAPNTLLAMATWRGQYALVGGMPWNEADNLLTLQPARLARLISVRFDPADPTDALTQVLLNDYPVEPLT